MGPAIPAIWFQQCLNALNDGGKHYPDIAEDGDIGPGTLAAFRAYRKARGTEADAVMLKALNALQGARYIELAQKRGANESFLYGWIRTRLARPTRAPSLPRPEERRVGQGCVITG